LILVPLTALKDTPPWDRGIHIGLPGCPVEFRATLRGRKGRLPTGRLWRTVGLRRSQTSPREPAKRRPHRHARLARSRHAEDFDPTTCDPAEINEVLGQTVAG